MNNGGLFGERDGWYEPSFNDAGWRRVALPDRWAPDGVPPGVGWYRTVFTLDLPRGSRRSRLGFGSPTTRDNDYEALIFLNGWMMGRYANGQDPQHLFYLPEGMLNPRGANSLAIAVLSHGIRRFWRRAGARSRYRPTGATAGPISLSAAP